MEQEYYSKSQPDLVVQSVKITLDKIIDNNEQGSTISEIIANKMYNFYNDYIKDNMFVLTLIAIFVIFLIYRYYSTKEEKQKQKKVEVKEDDQQITNDRMLEHYQDLTLQEIQSQTDHLMTNNQPHFNPLYGVNQQQVPVNYPPDNLPINTGNGMIYTKSLSSQYPSNYPSFNTPNYNYNNVYKNDTRSYYNGTYNTYKGAQDTNIQNPLGFSTNFNTNTGNFVGPMTNMNQQIIDTYNNNGRNKENDMISGAFSNYKPTLIPAYAT